jgi:hypothetical protein
MNINFLYIIFLLIIFYFLSNCFNSNKIIKKINPDYQLINKIYFINLDRSKNRLNLIQKYAQDANLKITRFPGFDGENLNFNHLFENNIFTDFIFKSKKGMIGCTYSHIKLWEKIMQSNDQYILILEDDVIIPKDFWFQFKRFFNQIPKNWDLIYLGASNIKGKKISKNVIKPIYGGKGLTNVGAYAMLFKKQSIIDIYKDILPVNDDFDVYIRDKYNKNKNIYYAYPPIILHNNELNSDRRIIDGNSPKAGFSWRTLVQSKVTIL